MTRDITFRPAGANDWEHIAALLRSANLPLEGAQEHLLNFVLAFRKAEPVGCAGLERYHKTGLLRSVAVTEAERGLGLGRSLIQWMLAEARETGVEQVVLLTETARGFFSGFGFREIGRSEVPAEVQASVEFQTVCPESATVMIIRLL